MAVFVSQVIKMFKINIEIMTGAAYNIFTQLRVIERVKWNE